MRTALDAPVDTLEIREQHFVAGIREHGWVATNVLAAEDRPQFTYTTGFWLTLGFPEIVVFSLAAKIAHVILWDIFREVRAGTIPPIGTPAGNFANTNGILYPVAPLHHETHFGWSRWFYGGDDFKSLQLIWPDAGGTFPSQPDADSLLRRGQPDLSIHGWPSLTRT